MAFMDSDRPLTAIGSKAMLRGNILNIVMTVNAYGRKIYKQKLYFIINNENNNSISEYLF